MRFRVKVLLLLAAVSLVVLPVPASGEATPPASTLFAGYATGTALHVNAVQVAAAGPLIENTALAFAGASVSSQGQTAAINNEMGLGVQPVSNDRESYGRGSGLEVGVAKTLPNNPDTNQVLLPGIAQAGALPIFTAPDPAPAALNQYQTGVKTSEVLKQSINPAAYAGVLRGQAQALWNDQSALAMVGNPMGFGLGYADDVQLVNLGAAPAPEADGLFPAPLVATDTKAASGERTTSQSMSFTYLVNNGDGTCGLASETRITMAPLRLNVPPDANPANDVTIEILGEYILRATATGKAPGTITFQPAKGPATGAQNEPILRIIQNETVTNVLTFQQIFGEKGTIVQPVPQLFSIAVGEDPRRIREPSTSNPDANSDPITTVTEASAAVDILRVRLLQTTPEAAGLNALDLRLGHFETKAVVPEGGINCEIPVKKEASPNPAQAGDDITFTISIPRTSDVLVPFPCELANIKAVDVHFIKSGNPRFTVIGGTGPNGEVGVVDGDKITFENIGTYKVGDPPLLVKVIVRLAPNSGPGELKDIVDVTATAANCKAQANAVGRAIGGSDGLAGLAGLTGSGLAGGGGAGLRGQGTLDGPTIPPRELPRTGPSDNLPVAAAVIGLMAVLGMRNLRRRSIA